MNTVTKIEWVALSVVAACFVLYLNIQTSQGYNLEAYIKKYKNFIRLHSPDDILANGNNGDLVFFCGDTKGERTCRWCTGSIFSHVALLFREIHPETKENILYVWEADVGQKYKRGPRIMKLEDKLKRYHGYPYLMWRKLRVDKGQTLPKTENIMRVVERYKHLEFDDNMMSWWFSGSSAYHLMKDKNTVFCSELIALTFQSIDISMMDTTYLPAYYSPGTFASHNILGLKRGYNYDIGTYVDYSSLK